MGCETALLIHQVLYLETLLGPKLYIVDRSYSGLFGATGLQVYTFTYITVTCLYFGLKYTKRSCFSFGQLELEDLQDPLADRGGEFGVWYLSNLEGPRTQIQGY